MAVMFGIDYYKNDGSGTNLSVSASSKHYTDFITSVGQNWGEVPQDWSRDGYTFVHWNTASDDSGDSYDGDALYTGKMITLYAIWQEAVQTPDISISLGNTEIATLSNSGSVTLATSLTFLTEDITITYTKR